MTATAPTLVRSDIRARHAGFFSDLIAVAGRAVRSLPRDKEAVIPALVIPVFFFAVNVGALKDFTEKNNPDPNFSFIAFQLPVAIIFAVTGISRASMLVLDIQSGYLSRLLATPIRRPALLLGLLIADFVLVFALSIPVIIMGWALGVDFATGPLGILAFILMSSLWGLAFAGFPYAIALKTGSPGAVNASFILFFPFAFLTTAFLPKEALTGWLSAVADYNPVTYLLDALRAVVSGGWEWDTIGKGLACVAAVGAVSFFLAFRALGSRVRPN